ncbi:MAG: DUF3040 domain-containing protein [Acidimicrobiia bacterium]
MPLSEEEQRILREIEANLTATDPALVQQVSETTLYRHATRTIKWAVLAFVVGLVIMLLTFTSETAVAVGGFLVMLAALLVIERNVRKMGKAGLDSITNSLNSGPFKHLFGSDGRPWRDRFRRDG